MVKASEIKDRESLEAWLNDQPQQVSVKIAHRAALRVGPILWDFITKSHPSDLTETAFLRANLIAGVAGTMPTPAIMDAASASYATAHSPAHSSVAYSASAYSASAYAASAYAAYASIDPSAVSVADASAYSASAYAAYASVDPSAVSVADASDYANAIYATAPSAAPIWYEVEVDARTFEAGIDPLALWSGPQATHSVWLATRRYWQKRGEDWAFWIDWYEAELKGEPLNIDMLTEIALIDPKDWDQGADHVNSIIRGIVARFEEVKTKPSKEVVQFVKKVSFDNRHTTPPQLNAIKVLLEQEHEKVRGWNPQDELDVVERDRQLEFFSKLLGMIDGLSTLVPNTEPAGDSETEETIGLLQLYANEFQEWPRENARDMVDSTVRVTLVGLSTGIMAGFGMPWLVAAGIGGVVFGGKKLVDIGKRIKDVAPTDGGAG